MMEVLRDNVEQLSNIKETDRGQFSRYDCICDDILIELKHRGNGRHFPDTLLEKKKYDGLDPENNRVLYVVYSCSNLYIFSLTKLTREGYDFNWHYDPRQPKTTYFADRTRGKEVSMLPWDKAAMVIPCNI